MTGRRVATLAVVALLVLVAAIWLASRNTGGEPTASGAKVLEGLQQNVNAVTEVRLSKGDGRRITLRKRDKDWVVSEREYPADPGRVRKLLLDLAALEVEEEKTRTAANYPQLGVEDVTSPNATGTLVEVIAPEKSYTLIVGKTAGTKASYVRAPKSEQSLLVRPQLHLDGEIQRWVDRTLLDIPQDRVREVSVKPAEGPAYTVKRESKEQKDFTVQGVPKGRALSSPAAPNSAASALDDLMLDDVRRKAAEAAQAVAAQGAQSATFHTFDGLAVEVTGRKEGERHFLTARAQASTKEASAEAERLNARLEGYEFEVPSWKYASIFRPLEELLGKSS